jgi:acyl-CoA synthetase (NDP forming)
LRYNTIYYVVSWQDRPTQSMSEESRVLLNYDDLAKSLLAAGVPLVAERLVPDAGAAAAAAAELGVPVALKLVSPELVHKSDVGAVILDVRGPDAAREAARRLTELAARLLPSGAQWQILVQEMAESSTVEVFVGLSRDPVFGAIVVVGAGGRLVELLPDRVIARCPVTAPDAMRLLRDTPVGTVLGGYRGQRDVLAEVAGVVAAASGLPALMPGVDEIDLNPVVITERGPLVVDARAVVSDQVAAPDPPSRPNVGADAFRALLEPDSIVVVGASAKGALQPGNRILGYLRAHGYAGKVTAIHPSAAQVDGYPAVPRIADLPAGSVDLACVAVPADACVDIVEQCGAIGVPAAVVISSGFAEVGNTDLERRLVEAADRHGIALCGPNTVGIMSPGKGVHVCFTQAQDMARTPSGGIALVVQSGALGGSLASQAWQRGIGIGRFISVGNQAALDTADYLEYLADDPLTDTIAVVLEGVRDGAALLVAVERAVAAGKSVLVFKVGRTTVGARAVQSHTGSIAGDYVVYRALLVGSGAIPVDSVTELLDALELRNASGGFARGSRVGVVSTSGGACSVIADVCAQYGFEVPVFSEQLQAELATVLPGYAALANPVDVTGRVATDPSIYGRTLALLLASDEVDAAVVMITTVADPMAEQLASEVAAQAAASDKPLVVSWTIAPELAPEGLRILREAGVPVFDDPARAVRAARLAGA